MNSYNNYVNYVEPPAPKNGLFYKKTPHKIFENNKYNRNYINNSAINLEEIKARATKYISDKRFQGELDIDSPGNKNILLDSDSEFTPSSKNLNNNTGCTKLVIEKVESQMPQVNREYYKFTNLKRNTNNDNIDQEVYFSKKNYVTKKEARYGSNLRGNNILEDREYLNLKYDNYNIPQQQGFIIRNNEHNNSMIRNNNRSTNNLFNTKYNYNQQSSNKKQNGNKNNSVIIRERNKYNNYINKDIYDNENNDSYNRQYLQEKPSNMKYYKIMNNKNYARKNKDININPQRNTLYENYQDLIKLNTFNRISQNNKRGYNGQRRLNKIRDFPGYDKKLVKIQSAWRGTYVRIIMGFYWNLVDFKNILQSILRNHIYDYFFDLVKNLSHYSPKKLKGKNKNYVIKEEKSLDEYKIALKQKEEDYDNLLKNYNALVERCTELQDLVNRNKSDDKKNWSSSKKSENDNSLKKKILEINRNKLNFGENNYEKDKWKKLKIDNNNVNIEIIKNQEDKAKTDKNEIIIEKEKIDSNNKNEIEITKINDAKKFDIIEIEKNDKFDIIIKKDNKEEIEIKIEKDQEQENKDNNLNLRAKYKKKKRDSYQNYVENFKSKLCMINADQLIIEETPKEKEIIPLKISKFEIPLLNNNEIKEEITKPKTFEIEFIEKVNDNELIISGIKKEIKEPIIIKPKIFEKEFIEKVNDNDLIIFGIKKEIKEPIIIKPKTFENDFIEKVNDNEILISGIKKEIIESDIKQKRFDQGIIEKIKDNEILISGVKQEIKEQMVIKPKIFENQLIEKVKDGELIILGNKKEIKETIVIKPKIFENQLIEKVKDGELIILGNKKEIKEPMIIKPKIFEKVNDKELIILGEKKEIIESNIKQKLFEKDNIEKIHNDELLILGIKNEDEKIDKSENINENISKECNLIEENQKNLNIEIKGKDYNFNDKNETINVISLNIPKCKIKDKEQIKEISKNDQFELINKAINKTPKIFENELIEKINDNELTILGTKKENTKHKKIKKKKEKADTENKSNEENQKDLNLENIEKTQIINRGFNNSIFIEKNNSLFIKQKKPNKIINKKTILKKKPKEIKENISENVEQFIIEGISQNKNENSNTIVLKAKKKKKKIKNKLENNLKFKNEFLAIEIIPAINNNLFIKQKRIKKCDKMTEITEDLNLILPCNNYELYIERIIKKITYINNKEQELSFMKQLGGNEIKNKSTYDNIDLEINKENALEINPLLFKKTPEITRENDMSIHYNKYAFFTAKAKKNMIKMILPIKLKTTLRDFVRRNTLPLLIKQLKEIAKLKQI